MINRSICFAKVLTALVITLFLAACASDKSIPLTIQSDPLGGHVAYQVNSSVKGTSSDWIYLGKTPLDIKRKISSKQLRKAQAFRLKIMKDGFSDQVRDWNGKDIKGEIEEKGHLFWNPKLVPSG